jgi:UDPglucose 6-dehydrogenase
MVYSTLPFGSSRKLRDVFREEGVGLDGQVGYVHFPLMIAQGTTAEDFVNPPFVVFGSYDQKSAGRAMRFYSQFIKRSSLYSGKLPPMFSGTPEEAELAKLSANAYLTTKIAVANEIGSLCEQLNMDGQKVMEIVGSDWRIGRKFTRPGYAVGGQCFPRDLKSLIETFHDSRVEPRILGSVNNSNEARILDPLDKVEGQKVLVLGTSYKEAVKDERGSQAHKLIDDLRTRGYSVRTFDPKLSPNRDMSTELKRNDTIIVMIPESSFRGIGKSLGGQTKVVLDYANIVEMNLIPRQVRLWKAGHGWLSMSGTL